MNDYKENMQTPQEETFDVFDIWPIMNYASILRNCRIAEVRVSLASRGVSTGTAYAEYFCDKKIENLLQTQKVKSAYMRSLLQNDVENFTEDLTENYAGVLLWGEKKETAENILVFERKGLFFQPESTGETVFLPYDAIASVQETADRLTVTAKKNFSVADDLSQQDGGEITVEMPFATDFATAVTKRATRHAIETAMSHFGWEKEDPEDAISQVIRRYIRRISLNKDCYLAEEYTLAYETAEENVKKSYPGIDNILAVIDCGIFNKGKNSFVFTRDGIYFKNMFSKHYIPYDKMTVMLQNDEKMAYLFGDEATSEVSIFSCMDYDLQALQECIRDIQCII